MALLNIPFEVEVSSVVERMPRSHASPARLAVRLAREKALDVASRRPGRTVVGADTIVVLDQEILGKPASLEDCRRMLGALSGRWHRVVTGLAVVGRSPAAPVLHGFESTRVLFRELTGAEIEAYVATGEPMDKAGAYAIQGRASLLISGIRGDYSNVVGLPLLRLAELLTQSGESVELYQPARPPEWRPSDK